MGEHQGGGGHTEKQHNTQNLWSQENELQTGNKLKVWFFFQETIWAMQMSSQVLRPWN